MHIYIYIRMYVYQGSIILGFENDISFHFTRNCVIDAGRVPNFACTSSLSEGGSAARIRRLVPRLCLEKKNARHLRNKVFGQTSVRSEFIGADKPHGGVLCL